MKHNKLNLWTTAVHVIDDFISDDEHLKQLSAVMSIGLLLVLLCLLGLFFI